MSIPVVSRSVKRAYEETKLVGKKQLFDFLFPELDEDESAGFLLDSLVTDTFGVSYRQTDMQSNVREYQAGSGQLIEPPRASEKTPITEKLRDAVISGVESTAGFQAHQIKLVEGVAKQHTSAFNMTKNKQALDVFVEGKFLAKAAGDKDLGLDIDYGRKNEMSLAYNFTDADATFMEALTKAQQILSANGAPLGGMFGILGAKWLNELSTDAGVKEYMKNNAANITVETQMMPDQFKGVEGLYHVATLRAPGMLAPFYLFAYQPGTQYKSSAGATAEPFIADEDAIWGSVDDTRYKVNRGVDALDGDERAVRATGDIVFDEFTQKDPVGSFVRSQCRHAFVPGNINHTSKTTGTFA